MLDQSFYQKADEIIAMVKAGITDSDHTDIRVYRYLPEELLTYVAEQIGVTEAKAFSPTFMRISHFDAKGNM